MKGMDGIGGQLVRDIPIRSISPYKKRTVEQYTDREIKNALCCADAECKKCEIYNACRFGQEYVRRQGK